MRDLEKKKQRFLRRRIRTSGEPDEPRVILAARVDENRTVVVVGREEKIKSIHLDWIEM